MNLDILDKSQVPPLHQKRIVAFVNHFLISSATFLNDFASKCESRFLDLERKIQRLEAGLTIIEAKLASIPADTYTKKIESEDSPNNNTDERAPEDEKETESDQPTPQPTTPSAETLVRACDDVRYAKFFKLMRFGVDPNAVKQKMEAEGFDSKILDTPNLVLPDGQRS